MSYNSSLNIIKVSFTFPAATMKLLRDYVPARKRSSFVAETIEKELRKRAFLKAARETTGILDKKKYPHWSSKAKITKWINSRRAIDAERLEELWNKRS